MAEKKPQNLANHAKFDPLFHFVVGPVFAPCRHRWDDSLSVAPQLSLGVIFRDLGSGGNCDLQDSPLRT